MKQREPYNEPSKIEVDLDRISNLPAQIIDKILSHMSLKDAVRTSVLSSKWRYKWATLPNLIFDTDGLSVSAQDHAVIKSKIVSIVDHVLLLHMGSIHKFKLSHRDLQNVLDIDKWILFLSRGSIKEFILEIWKGHRYKLPSAIYLCQKLVHLELFNCLLIPPRTFCGFKCLKSLDLQHITMEQEAFEHLISSCSLLERLTLMNFDGFTRLKIHAPNLLFFDVGGMFDDLSFKDTSHLATVSIGLYSGYDNQNLGLASSGNLVKFFANLPRIQRLEVQSYFLKYLAAGMVPGKLSTPCNELSYLSLRINFNNLDECLAALCLLRSSPNLRELEIGARTEEQNTMRTIANFMEEKYQNFKFNRLHVVKISAISGFRQELNFIKFLLGSSPVLESMTIKPASIDGAWDMLKELLRYRRASVQAEIIYLDP
ncbi:F-box/FBD/LRR-repeat protein At1g13570-like [Ipomoea triloba]|uniref:F-box/FBD/LRR-repeat protein At1g13570-like n=1 Tax=Ipomoea triloba TaxID=35885 RepID=UPI00125DD78B|nr:F-box/FBD/LRR-repeat protein At1g13570-like [Ipomoea triloba]